MPQFTEQDLHVAKKLGEFEAYLKSQRDLLMHINDKMDDAFNKNRKEKDVMWGRIDKHGRLITWIIGVSTGLYTALGAFLSWMKMKMGTN